MYNLKKILFPVDFSDRSRATAPFVLSLAQRYRAKVVLIHAFEPPPPIYGGMNMVYPEVYDFAGVAAEIKQQLIAFQEAELPKTDAECVVQQGFAAPVITDFAAENQVDLIVMPTHGYGSFRRALLGSVTAKVLHDSNVPVWTDAHAPEPSHRAHPQPRVIVVALDLKSDSKHALEAALQLAKDAGATVEMVHAAPEGEITPISSEAQIGEVLEAAARDQHVDITAAGIDVNATVDTSSIARLVRDVAIAKRADLIVIGRGRIQEALGRFKANAYGIIREAPCPVLSVAGQGS